jgi:hypothetical protein
VPEQILRPNNDGTHGTYPWQIYPSSPATHYDKVDEVTPDEDATTLSTTDDLENRIDHLNKETLSLPPGATITAVRVYMRCKYVPQNPSYVATPLFKQGVRIGSTDYWNPFQVNPTASYADYYYSWAKNPATNNDWTESDVNNAQIALLGNSNFMQDEFLNWWYTYVYCTQVWVVVVYSMAGETSLRVQII